MNEISLIIPIYNTEPFIERCLVSVCEQTLPEFEIILVNDKSPDNALQKAIQMLEKYPHRKAQTQIIDLPENVGSGKVREIAIKKANGKYIASLDSDDYFSENALQEMLKTIKNENADVVVCDFINDFGDKQTIVKQNFSEKDDLIKLLLTNHLHGSYCNKLYKKELLDKITFVQGINMHEDLLAAIQVFSMAEKIVYLPKSFLHYMQINPTSQLTIFSQKSLQNIIDAMEFKAHFLNNYWGEKKYEKELNFHRIYTKIGILTLSSHQKRKEYIHFYPNAHKNLPHDVKLPMYSLAMLLAVQLGMWAVNGLVFLRNFIKKFKR